MSTGVLEEIFYFFLLFCSNILNKLGFKNLDFSGPHNGTSLVLRSVREILKILRRGIFLESTCQVDHEKRKNYVLTYICIK